MIHIEPVTYLLSNMAVNVQCKTVNEQTAVKLFARNGGFECPAPAHSQPVFHCIAKTHPSGEVIWG